MATIPSRDFGLYDDPLGFAPVFQADDGESGIMFDINGNSNVTITNSRVRIKKYNPLNNFRQITLSKIDFASLIDLMALYGVGVAKNLFRGFSKVHYTLNSGSGRNARKFVCTTEASKFGNMNKLIIQRCHLKNDDFSMEIIYRGDSAYFSNDEPAFSISIRNLPLEGITLPKTMGDAIVEWASNITPSEILYAISSGQKSMRNRKRTMFTCTSRKHLLSECRLVTNPFGGYGFDRVLYATFENGSVRMLIGYDSQQKVIMAQSYYIPTSMFIPDIDKEIPVEDGENPYTIMRNILIEMVTDSKFIHDGITVEDVHIITDKLNELRNVACIGGLF